MGYLDQFPSSGNWASFRQVHGVVEAVQASVGPAVTLGPTIRRATSRGIRPKAGPDLALPPGWNWTTWREPLDGRPNDGPPCSAYLPADVASRSASRSPVVTAPSDADETKAAYLAMTPVL